MKEQLIEAIRKLKTANRQANPQVRKEADEARMRLTHNERMEVSILMNQARDAGTTVTELGQWYGTSDRRTIMDLIEYLHTAPESVQPLESYFKVEEVDEYQVRVRTIHPVPAAAWSTPPDEPRWEGEVVTDGVITSENNPLWVELKTTDLASRLGIGDLFNGV